MPGFGTGRDIFNSGSSFRRFAIYDFDPVGGTV
jgi:hypothetical protein